MLFRSENPVVLTTPSRTGYTFGGWYTTSDFQAGTKLTRIVQGSTGNITLYAQWTVTTYTITYYLNGGVQNADNPTVKTYNVAVTLKAPTRTNYTFDGWYSNSGLTTLANTIAASTNSAQSRYATWTGIQSTVTFDVVGGTGTAENITITHGSVIQTLPTLTKTDHNVCGWRLSDESTHVAGA